MNQITNESRNDLKIPAQHCAVPFNSFKPDNGNGVSVLRNFEEKKDCIQTTNQEKSQEKDQEQILDYIRPVIHTKIANTYSQLDPKLTVPLFIKHLYENTPHIFEECHQRHDLKEHLDQQITHYLIRQTYFELSGKYLLRFLMKKLSISNPNDIRLLEISDYIREKLEEGNLRKLITFKEKCTFKTFLTTAITRLYIDFYRAENRTKKNVTLYENDMKTLGLDETPDTLSTLITLENEETQEAASEILPEVLNVLPPNERLAIKLKYQHQMKISAIARTLNTSRHKALQLLSKVEEKISKIIKKKIKHYSNQSNYKGGNL